VRERSVGPAAHGDCRSRTERPAHPSNQLVAQLNERWRVVDDPLQWRLQQRRGNPRTKNSGWRDRSHCRTRDALLRCVGEHCGEIDDNPLSKIKSLPDRHPDSDCANLDVRGTGQARADAQGKVPVSEELEVFRTGNQPPRRDDRASS
jgi:hypothetical protein